MVPKLTMVIAPFFCGGLFCLALPGASILDHTRQWAIQGELERIGCWRHLAVPCQFTTAPQSAVAYRFRTAGFPDVEAAALFTAALPCRH